MNKIEEIFEKNITQGYYDDFAVDCHRSEVEDALIEFGKICFEAGRKGYDFFEIQKSPGLYDKHYYKTYENFLKEIEDEARD